MTSDAILARLTRLHPKLIDLSLDRVTGLLARLGNPHLRLPPVVHVAGTNGKGSVIAFIRAIVEAAGLKVHVYSSPHLKRFHERIYLAGREISDDALSPILERCEQANDGDITFFEITTAAAFLAFSQTPADLVLLETGLGGRLDATNMLDKPALSVITPISLDHQGFLGESLAEIAAEKAGILKSNVACVSARQPDPAATVVEKTAQKLGCPLLLEGRDYDVSRTDDGLRLAFRGRRFDLPRPNLEGAHQWANAAQAAACVLQLQNDGVIRIADKALATGLDNAVWPGRLQRLRRGPLCDLLPPGWELWLDGGHNPGAAAALAKHAQGWRDRPLYVIIGMMQGKHPEAFLAPLRPHITALGGVGIPGEENAYSAEEIAAAGRALKLTAAALRSPEEALRQWVGMRQGPARILICGSLYLAGVVLEDHQ